MKIALNIIDAMIDVSFPDKNASQISLVLKEAEDTFHSLHYWGKHGKKRKSIKKIADLSDLIKKIKSGIYVLSDVEKGNGATELHFSFRQGIINIQLFRDCERENLLGECNVLIKYFKSLYTNLQEVIVFPLASSIGLPEIEYAKLRPPKRWRVFDPWGIIDFIKPSKIDFPDAKKITHSLSHGALPAGVVRQLIDDDMIVVDWTRLSPKESRIDEKLSKRSVWYFKNSEFETDSSFNDIGDEEVYIFENKKTIDFTFYDVMTQIGYKAIGFDPNSYIYETDKINDIRKLLKNKRTSEGLPLLKTYIIVNKREFAIFMRPVVQDQLLSGVIYADEAGRLWNPFPDGLWLN